MECLAPRDQKLHEGHDNTALFTPWPQHPARSRAQSGGSGNTPLKTHGNTSRHGVPDGISSAPRAPSLGEVNRKEGSEVTGTLRVIQPREGWAKGDSSVHNGRGQAESPGPGPSRTALGTDRAGSLLGTGKQAHVLPRASSRLSSYRFLTQQVKIKSLLLNSLSPLVCDVPKAT